MLLPQEIIADLCRLRSTKRVNLDSFSEGGGGGGNYDDVFFLLFLFMRGEGGKNPIPLCGPNIECLLFLLFL